MRKFSRQWAFRSDVVPFLALLNATSRGKRQQESAQRRSSRFLHVVIGDIAMLPNNRWAPYANMLLVDLPADHAQRREVFKLVENIGRPDDEDEPLIDCGQSTIRLWLVRVD
jgi:hypothetical protein